MIYMYRRPNYARTPYMFTDNIHSTYCSDGTCVEAITTLLPANGMVWPCWLEESDDRFLLVDTFETIIEFKNKYPELLI